MSLIFIEGEPSTPPAIATLILLHGLGADEHDLMGLAPELNPRLRVISVRAPLLSEWGGSSWFGIDLGEGELRVDGAEARVSLETLASFLEELEGPLILGGFSQGAMMTIGILLERGELIDGAIAMSGGLLPCFQSKSQTQTSVFMTHGRLDPVVPFEFGRSSAKELESLGYSVEFRAYEMGHSISEACLVDLNSWMDRLLDRI